VLLLGPQSRLQAADQGQHLPAPSPHHPRIRLGQLGNSQLGEQGLPVKSGLELHH
jgi:hypothetical protein